MTATNLLTALTLVLEPTNVHVMRDIMGMEGFVKVSHHFWLNKVKLYSAHTFRYVMRMYSARVGFLFLHAFVYFV